MMRFILFIVFIIVMKTTAIAQSTSYIHLTYDAAGNRIQRSLVVILAKTDESFFHNKDSLILKDTIWDDQLSSNYKNDEIKISNGLISVYPNPLHSILNFNITSKEDIEYSTSIYDLSGKLILEQNMKGNNNELDLSDLQAAYYFVVVKTEKEKIVWKIIKN